jgi:hypothetical protein
MDSSLECAYIPDALFTWYHYFNSKNSVSINYGDMILPYPYEKFFGNYNFKEPYICVGGSSIIRHLNKRTAVERYQLLINSIKSIGTNIYIVNSSPGDNFLSEVSIKTNVPIIPLETPILLAGTILAKSEVFVSGRYHPSILASLGGTPCVMLKSNSHKTLSLQRVLGYKNQEIFSALPSEDEITKIMKTIKLILKSKKIIRKRIKNKIKELNIEAKGIAGFIDN